MLSSDIKPAKALPTSLEDAEDRRVPEPETIIGDADAKEGQNLGSTGTTASADVEYPSGLSLGLIITSAFVSIFLVALVSISTRLVFSRPIITA